MDYLISSSEMKLYFVVQSLNCVQLFLPHGTAAHQTSLSFTISRSLLKLMSIESLLPSNHLILCYPLLLRTSVFPSIRVFAVSWLFASSGQSIGVSALASVLPMNIQGWFLLGLTGLISLQSKGLSGVFSKTTVQKHQNYHLTLWRRNWGPWRLMNVPKLVSGRMRIQTLAIMCFLVLSLNVVSTFPLQCGSQTMSTCIE